MKAKAKGARSERKARESLKELGYSLLGVVLAIILIGFVICMKVGAYFISPLVSYCKAFCKKMGRV